MSRNHPGLQTHSSAMPETEPNIEQQKILRIFQLIRMLVQLPAKTIPQLAQRLETTKRTTYRYINLLESLNYPVEKDFDNRYYISGLFGKDVQGSFAAEEAQLLHDLLQQAAPGHALTTGILTKLYLNSELKPLADSLLRTHTAAIIHNLSVAMRERRQVVLKNYHSVNSQTIADRQVSPLYFTDNYVSVHAYETATQQERTFKLDRIEAVALLPDAQTQSAAAGEMDAFGMTGPAPLAVTLHLTHRAYRLMREEYPVLEPCLSRQADGYRFEGTVRSWLGIGRFILGLCTEIRVVSPPELREFLNEKMKNLKF